MVYRAFAKVARSGGERCAVGGAPVTSWDGYDTHYTERYMGGTPQQLPSEYEAASVGGREEAGTSGSPEPTSLGSILVGPSAAAELCAPLPTAA